MKIALSGGPCSGKSSILEILEKDPSYQHFCFINEVATQILKSRSFDFSCPKQRLSFQREIFIRQRLQELFAGRDFIVDRSLADGCAYLTSTEEFEDKIGRLGKERYDLVIYLTTVPQTVYSNESNCCRSESYQEALELSRKTLDAVVKFYGDRCIVVGGTFENKLETVRALCGQVARNIPFHFQTTRLGMAS